MRAAKQDARRAFRIRGAALTTGGILILAAAVTGCTTDDCFGPGNCPEALPPVNVYAVTGDEAVTLFWTPTGQAVDRFVVYRSNAPEGDYYEIGHTGRDHFTDYDVRNGRTYFYGVSAVDPCGYESALNREIVHDTPRPEGFGDVLYNAESEDWRRSGWDFDQYRALPWDHPEADIYFYHVDGVPLLVATDLDTDIQDAGLAGFDDIDWAPEGGWSPTGTAEAIAGHAYVVWTRDNHYAKVRATYVNEERVDFDWGYQVDRGNPELAPRPGRELTPQGFRPGSRTGAN